MPNTKSAIRRVRRVNKQTFVNRIRKSKYKSIIKEISLLIAAKKKKEAMKFGINEDRLVFAKRIPVEEY